MAEEIKEEKIEDKEEIKKAHEMAGEHFHVLKRLDGKYSVISEVDENEIKEVSVHDSEDEAKSALEAKAVADKGDNGKEAEKQADDNYVEITDSIDEEADDPEEVREYEEEIKSYSR